VSIDLTEEGFKHKDDVADVIFSYIHLLNTPVKALEPVTKNGIPPYIYSEVAQLSAIAFNFSEKSDPASSVSRLVADMQDFTDPVEYVTGPRLYEHSDPSAVQSYLDHLTPKDVRIKLISTEYKGKTTQEGKYYGSQYNRRSLPEQTKKWDKTVATGGAYASQLAVPLPNELIPMSFTLLGKPAANAAEKEKLNAAPPTKLREDDKFVLWHKLDRTFNQPKVFAITTLAVPSSFYDTSFVVRAKLFSACFMDSMTEFLYDARLADMGFELEFTSKGVQLLLSGYSDKLAPFTAIVFEKLRTYEPDVATFNRFKDLLEREFKGWKSQQPYYHVSYYASLASETLQFDIKDVEKTLSQTSPKDLKNFLSSMLTKSHGTAIVIGNIDEKQSKDIVNIIEKAFPFTSLAVDLRSRRRPVEFPVSPLSVAGLSSKDAAASTTASGLRLTRPGPNEKDDNSATTFYFQLPTREIDEYVLLEILSESVEQAFYNSLRTQQQLGYIVYSGVRSREGIYSLTFTVQSALVDGAELSRRIEAFVESAIASAESISQEELESYQEGLAVRKLEPDQRLTSQASRFWGEIIEHEDLEEPIFDRHIKEVKAIRAVTRESFGKFTRDFLSPSGSKRRLLVSQITSTKGQTLPPAALADPKLSKPVYLTEITDELAFRKSRQQL
jgi:insulysin